jgi:hypothetical protein
MGPRKDYSKVETMASLWVI